MEQRSASPEHLQTLVQDIKLQGRALGFSQIGISGVELAAAEAPLLAWLAAGHHGEMDYMRRHGLKRARPAELVPGTLRVITARMDYLPRHAEPGWRDAEWRRLEQPAVATVSLYARGRDYHKVLRARLQQLADFIATRIEPGIVRVFTDSAPVLEVELAARAGLGWRGKHTLLLHRDGGSMFFLGEIFVGLPLPVDDPVRAHCGSCTRCITVCPTQAILGPEQLDARRCISYLTIEHAGPIPVELRRLMGNRIYGCDDCQLVCPWNRYAQRSTLPDFDPRQGLDQAGLLDLWGWTEAQFLQRTEGSAIRRIGFARWQRNLAVAMGNGLRESSDAAWRLATIQALQCGAPNASVLLREHMDWALSQAVERPNAARR
ncbi:MAG: tRNA epoxyqueuosine(34) reductase QueG [Thiomonas sp. 20-64-5]|nr:MAG: tRNA epoxyqueuosine(34) reductase QueG [Thiomonas sp. 20-64-5]